MAVFFLKKRNLIRDMVLKFQKKILSVHMTKPLEQMEVLQY